MTIDECSLIYLSQLVETLDQLMYILRRFRVSFELHEDDSYSECEDKCWTSVMVRGNRICSYNHDTQYLMAWLTYEGPEGFGTVSTGFKDSKNLTLLDVIEFCEEYHRRVFLSKERKKVNKHTEGGVGYELRKSSN